MSSLRDDVNSRAYASADRYHRNRDLDDGLIDTGGTCVVCGEDGIEVDCLSRCADCAPRGEETCEEWQARVAPRRKR